MYLIFTKKTVAAILSAAVLLTGIFAASRGLADHTAAETAASAGANWGLSFQTEGAAPIGNASAAELKKSDAYYLGDPSKKKIWLTFDAGYENGYTAHILDVLKKHHAPATFFLVGNFLQTQPELVRRMAEEGHTIGNHTFTHPDMSSMADPKDFSAQLQQLEELYQKTVGKPMEKYYRPPGGKYSEENLKAAKKLGYKTIFWSLAYVDWYNEDQPTREEAFEKLLPRIHNGAVVLLHSTSRTNAEILDELLTKWEQQGYTIAPISELVQ